MWAERPATAAQLRAGTAQLSQALTRAELTPGDIVIRDGAPPQAQPAPRRPLPGPRAMSVEAKYRLAVALHYDRSGAPRVVAKGKGTIGEKIIEVAKAHDIPIEENEVLAGALSHVELGDEIPAELYKAVAEVLVFVLRLSGKSARNSQRFERPPRCGGTGRVKKTRQNKIATVIFSPRCRRQLPPLFFNKSVPP